MKSRFEPLRTKRKRAKITAYDLEWHTGEESCFCGGGCTPYTLALAGFYDERGYRSYKSLGEAFAKELSADNEGRMFFAHFGGRADILFLIEQILKTAGYELELAMSGSAAVIAKVSKRRADGKSRIWLFVDSFFLLPVALAKIGKFIGLEKGSLQEARTETELREYNLIDNKILYLAIKRMQEILYELGGELRATIASCGMNLFRRRYLSSTIVTTSDANAKAVESYFASRVEPRCLRMPEGWEADINSSFPFSMTPPHPGSLKGYSRRIPDSGHYIAKVRVTVFPHTFPVLPVRREGRIVFPTGTWEGYYNDNDLRLLESEKLGRIERVDEVILFETRDDLGGYANDIFGIRARAKKALQCGDEASRFLVEVMKFLLNCLYGKLAEGEEKERYHLNADEEELSGDEIHFVFPGCYSVEETRAIQHRNVAMASHVVSLSRGYLYHGAKELDFDVAYMDTDSLHSPRRLPEHYFGEELGRFKDEGRLRDMVYPGPKVYCGFNETKGEPIYKAKGFSLPKDPKEKAALFEKLLQGESIPVRRMCRVREYLNTVADQDQVVSPFDVPFPNGKRLFMDGFKKRRFLPDGSSVPWTIEEIDEQLGTS